MAKRSSKPTDLNKRAAAIVAQSTDPDDEGDESGEQFFSGRDTEVYFLTIEEAFELRRLTFSPIHAQE